MNYVFRIVAGFILLGVFVLLPGYSAEANNFVSPPKEISVVKPQMPEIPADVTVSPVMRVRFFIDKKGKVEHVFVEKSSGYSPVDEAVKTAIMQWEFTPAIGKDSKPHASIIGMTVTLPLQKNASSRK